MEDGEELRLHNDHNVYILGAGFSVPAGLPVIANFMNTMRDGLFWLRAQERQEEARAVEEVLSFRLRAARAAERIPLDLENIEEIFSLVSSSGDSMLMQSATLAIAATLDYAQATARQQAVSVNVFGESDIQIPSGWHGAGGGAIGGARLRVFSLPAYDFFLLILSGGRGETPPERRDTIITFNYDLLVEKALTNLGVPVDYGFMKLKPNIHDSFASTDSSCRRAFPVLKLHGSVNWAESDGGLSIYGDYTKLRELAPKGPMLVPPTWNKTMGPSLSDVWDSAVRALSTATRIVVMGYSVPVTDNYFKYLLATGLQENVSLRKIFFVNPDAETMKQRASVLFRDELRARNIEFLGVDTSGFFSGLRALIARDFVKPFRA